MKPFYKTKARTWRKWNSKADRRYIYWLLSLKPGDRFLFRGEERVVKEIKEVRYFWFLKGCGGRNRKGRYFCDLELVDTTDKWHWVQQHNKRIEPAATK